MPPLRDTISSPLAVGLYIGTPKGNQLNTSPPVTGRVAEGGPSVRTGPGATSIPFPPIAAACGLIGPTVADPARAERSPTDGDSPPPTRSDFAQELPVEPDLTTALPTEGEPAPAIDPDISAVEGVEKGSPDL